MVCLGVSRTIYVYSMHLGVLRCICVWYGMVSIILYVGMASKHKGTNMNLDGSRMAAASPIEENLVLPDALRILESREYENLGV